jgi:NDP-sugar pyrophosphorylase family protein
MNADDSNGSMAVILAGGRGTRLAPYTTVIPKPLLPIGDEPILDVVLRQLAWHGFTDITLAVGYLAHLIEAVFRDGSHLGVSLRYHHETHPLGTVGPLTGIDDLADTFLMMNGDVLTTLDYGDLFDAHTSSGNALTVATHVRTVTSDYGVLELDGASGATRRVVGFREKPAIDHSVSMGVYVVDRRVCQYIPFDEPFDLPDLVGVLLEAGEQVGSYAYDGFWLDIGRHDDYEKAIAEYEPLKNMFLQSSGTRPGKPRGRVSRNGGSSNGASAAARNGNGNGARPAGNSDGATSSRTGTTSVPAEGTA